MSRFERTAYHLLPAIAYGDAAGLPVETRSAEYIANTHGTIDRLLPTTENPFYKGLYEAGTWSDDTELSIAVARSLIKANGFDMRAIADEHVTMYGQALQITKPNGQTVVRGWGRSTTTAVQRYMEGVPIEQCGARDGAGNGIIMKMAPLALWHIALETDHDEVYRDLDSITTFTHGLPVARVASRVHFDMLSYLSTRRFDAREFTDFAYWSALDHQRDVEESGTDVSQALSYLIDCPQPTTQDILDHTDGKGFYVPQTLAMAYGAFMAHNGQFAPSVYEAVNLGGDTDSTGSIVAAMTTIKGLEPRDIPRDLTKIMKLAELQQLSQSFARSIKTARAKID
ncbi:ADP-ribosylglycohydrolase family protein [Patescibacteria group bacterium]|jgi:ADP-ribosyl-[dinitrogen reductase] hydrolase|nr:ADP-ribosylglycohydrolase family protein [Patescibacteria group bacterium]